MAARTETEKCLHRLLKQDLGKAVKRTKRGTWTTTSNLPHEIRLHTQAGVEMVRASGTATRRELAVWLDQLTGSDCWIDREDDNVIVVNDCTGIGSTYPCTLEDLRQAAIDGESAVHDDDEEEPEDELVGYNEAPPGKKRRDGRFGR